MHKNINLKTNAFFDKALQLVDFHISPSDTN